MPTPILDQSAKLAIIFVHPKDMWLTGPDSGSFMSKWCRPYLVVLTRGITADLSLRIEYCDRFSAKRFSIKVGAMLLTISNTSRAILFTLFLCRYPAPAVAQLVECRTRNRESPGSNPRCYRFEVWAFSFTSRRLSRLSCINEYLAIDSGGNVSE